MRTHGLPLRELLADAGYANGPNYARLEAQHITARILVFAQFMTDIEGFTYNCRSDAFSYPGGKALPFQIYDTDQDGGWHKIYWATCRACQLCPRNPVPHGHQALKQLPQQYDACIEQVLAATDELLNGRQLRRLHETVQQTIHTYTLLANRRALEAVMD